MTDTELRLAIDQAWAHTQKTSPGPELEEAKQHLTHLRAVQASRAAHVGLDAGGAKYPWKCGPL